MNVIDFIKLVGPEWNTEQVAQQNFEICKTCPELVLANQFCKQCSCWAPKKVYFKNTNCPLGKW